MTIVDDRRGSTPGTFISAVVALIEAIVFFTMTDETFAAKYPH